MSTSALHALLDTCARLRAVTLPRDPVASIPLTRPDWADLTGPILDAAVAELEALDRR